MQPNRFFNFKMMRIRPPMRQLAETPSFWLAASGICLAAIHLSVTWRSEELNLLGLSVVFWVAVASLLWERRQRLSFQSDRFSNAFGTTLLILISLKSIFLTGGTSFPRLFPIFAGIGLAAIASGIKGLPQYWREMLILFLLGGLELLLPLIVNVDPSLLTAQFATYLLWYLGLSVIQQGTLIHLPSGSVEVAGGCSGLTAMLHLFSLSMLFLLIFPLKRQTKILLPIVAIILGFIINGIRVALMAVLVAARQQEAFDYWHEGNGSLLFSLLGILLFGGICLLVGQHPEEGKSKTHQTL